MPGISEKKRAYSARLHRYINEYSRIFVVLADNVGSRQLQQIRLSLRGMGEVCARETADPCVREYACSCAWSGSVRQEHNH